MIQPNPQAIASPAMPIASSLRTILAATDFSAPADVALAWAQSIARSHGASVELVHALDLPLVAAETVAPPVELLDAIEQAAKRRLAETVVRIRNGGCPIEARLAFGPPSQVVLDLARELAPDLIVLGTRGLTGLRHLLLGSTTERVVRRAEAPVLSVHPENGPPERSLRTILVPTDLSEDADLATAAALRLLACEPDARLVLLHVYNLPIEYTAYGPIPLSLSYLEEAGAQAQARLEEKAAALRRTGLAVETRVREGYPPEVIAAEAERCGADLIAMGTRGRSGLGHLLLGSVAERVVQTAGRPVLTVRRPTGTGAHSAG
ncbi:MAG TPA: universal stress protein [Thermoanaerobaculia bacterium]|jgi:nucleotide-binding universal stress UspA family protein|nr:universal stress protein [Thermoanaerobaculia bacterium]